MAPGAEITFFLAEMGDKTQVVTIALAAQLHDFCAVVSGTTSGMMLANVPVIYLGNRFANRLPIQRYISSHQSFLSFLADWH